MSLHAMGPDNNTKNNQANQTPRINKRINQVIHVMYVCEWEMSLLQVLWGWTGKKLTCRQQVAGPNALGRINIKQLCGATRPITVVAVSVQHRSMQALYQLRGSLFTLFQPLSTVRRFLLWPVEWDCRYRWLHYSPRLGSGLEMGWQS